MNSRAIKQPRHSAAMWFDAAQHTGVSRESSEVLTQPTFTATWGGIVTGGSTPAIIVGYIADFLGWSIFLYEKQLMILGGAGGYWVFGETTLPVSSQYYRHALICSGNVLSWYVDGSLLTATSFPLTYGDACRLVVGQHYNLPNYPAWITGCIHDVRYYNRALSISELAARQPPTNGLLLHWPGQGTSLAHWQDVSGNGLHATEISGNNEQCLIHQRGAVIRTDGNNNRYIVT